MKLPFAESGGYCIDTSALLELDYRFKESNPVFTNIWKDMEQMINDGLLVTSDYVELEVNDYAGAETFVKEWISKHKKRLVIPTDPEVLASAGRVINENLHLGFPDPKKWQEGKNDADPFLIGVATVRSLTIITQESKNKPNKIPQIAAKYGVRSIDVYDFMAERGFRMTRS